MTLDQVSAAIGRLQGKVEGVEKKLDGLCIKVDNIDRRLTDYQLRNAKKAGSISLVVSVIINAITTYIRFRL